jgi:hypothetical protein
VKVLVSLLGLVIVALAAAYFVGGFWTRSADAVPGSGTLYGTDAGTAQLYSISKITGVGTPIGDMGAFTAPALTVDPLTGDMYAGSGGSSSDLYLVNPGDASTALEGNSGLGESGYGGMDFDSAGVLYASLNVAGAGGIAGSGADHLVTVNKATGMATVVGPFGVCAGVTIPNPGGANGSCTIEGIEAIAFDSAGTLWGVENERGDAGTPGLYTINKNTGAATLVVAPIDDAAAGLHPSGGVISMQFSCDGTLYAGTARRQGGANVDGGMLGKINTTTGEFTFISAAPITSGDPANSLGGLAELESVCPFDVEKDFVPDNAGSVTVAVNCTDGGVGTPTDATASEADDANFTVSGFTLGSDPTCTATETGVPLGYSINQCSALLSAGSCTIVNTPTSTTLTVYKVYDPAGPLDPVPVSVVCTSGTPAPAAGAAAPGAPFVTTVTGFLAGGTTCTATETVVPAGYFMTSNCVNVTINHGVPASCTITNSLTPPSVGGIVSLIDGAASPRSAAGGEAASYSAMALAAAAIGGVALTAGGLTAVAVRRRRR